MKDVNVVWPNEATLVCSAEPVFGFIQRTAGNVYKAAVVSFRPTSCALGQVRTDAIGRPHKLPTDCFTLKSRPFLHDVPHSIGQV